MKLKHSKRNVAALLSFALFTSSFGINEIMVYAEENSEQQASIVDEEMPIVPERGEIPIEFEDNILFSEQIPEELTSLPKEELSTYSSGYKVGNKLTINKTDMRELPSTLQEPSTYQVIGGQGQDYLIETGDMKLFGLSINPGIYLQAQLKQPNDANLDYDLYILDEEGNILSGSENITYINGSSGTLPETAGYMTTGTAASTYYLAAISSSGGSDALPFTIEYSVSNAFDPLEMDENPTQAHSFPIYTEGANISVRNLSSPIDNDWYVLTVPSSRIYDTLSIYATTVSGNKCKLEIFQNISSNGLKMKKISFNGELTPTAGIYYLRLSNEKSLAEFNDADIQNYSLNIKPILKPNKILIESLNGNEGVNFYVKYPQFKDSYFRTKDWLEVIGYVVCEDPVTGDAYQMGKHSVTAKYQNEAWNIPEWRDVIVSGESDYNSQFKLKMNIPKSMGVESWDAGLTTQYFDLCKFKVELDDNSNINHQQTIINFKYSVYN